MADFSRVLLVSDFDMTMTDLQHKIPENNKTALEYFIANGGRFTIGTGRAKPVFMPPIPVPGFASAAEVKMNAPCIMSNGALIYDFETCETVEITPLSPDEEAAILKMRDKFCSAIMNVESGLEVYLPEEVYALAENDFTRKHYEFVKYYAKLAPLAEIPRPWLKAVFTADPEFVLEIEAYGKELGVEGVRSLPFMYEIQSHNSGKGIAARSLAKRLGCEILVCAGDAENDLSMLKEADIAFIPANAGPEMRSFGFREAAHCDEGTIADVIATLIREL